MNSYTLHTKKTWAETRGELALTFERWGVIDWNVITPSALKPSQLTSYQYNPTDRAVTVRWTSPKEKRELRLSLSDQSRPVDNFRALYMCIEAMRMNEVRGIGRLMQDAYMQLSAPVTARDPYEVLGVRPNASLEVIEAAYRANAKLLHPDTDHGDVERMKELNNARDRIRAERAAERQDGVSA